MTIDFDTFEKRLLADSEFRKEVERVDLKRDISRMVIEARIIKGITQEKLAEMTNTQQPSIARLENGNSLPSLKFLDKIARALKTRLIVTFDLFKMNEPTFKANPITETLIVNTLNKKEQISAVPIFLNSNSSYASERRFYDN